MGVAENFEVMVILRLKTAGKFLKDPRLNGGFTALFFFLLQCRAAERLGNLEADQ